MTNKKPSFLYQDDSIVVIDKPERVLSIPDRFDCKKVNLRDMLKDTLGEIFVVHRLDKDTSGAIIFARNTDAHRNLCSAFESGTVGKKYLAIVNGTPADISGEIDVPLIENPSARGSMIAAKKGKESVTRYRVIESFVRFSLVECIPLTGRTHQIRVHMKHIGHPLIVDPLYGEREAFFLSEIKKKYRTAKDTDELPFLSRVPLHSAELSFAHPITNDPLIIEAPLHKDMSAVLAQFRKIL